MFRRYISCAPLPELERIMRTFTLSTVVALLLAGSSLAAAQTSPAPSQSQTSQSQTKSEEGVEIRSIQVIDVEELKADLRSQVDALVTNTKQEEIRSLRTSIEAIPQAMSALKAKGRNSAQVVAINVDKEGVLTMFTKRAT
jgi:Spy/CpxP family protein refolding chaperone